MNSWKKIKIGDFLTERESQKSYSKTEPTNCDCSQVYRLCVLASGSLMVLDNVTLIAPLA